MFLKRKSRCLPHPSVYLISQVLRQLTMASWLCFINREIQRGKAFSLAYGIRGLRKLGLKLNINIFLQTNSSER